MRISDWSSDVCSSDLLSKDNRGSEGTANGLGYKRKDRLCSGREPGDGSRRRVDPGGGGLPRRCGCAQSGAHRPCGGENSIGRRNGDWDISRSFHDRSEEHTSELQSLMRISYAVFCLKKKHTAMQTAH